MGTVFRCFVEKKKGLDGAAAGVSRDLRDLVGLHGLTGARVFKRYDVEGMSRADYERARTIVFSEPQVDEVWDEALPALPEPCRVLAVEALPGQFDQRADSAAQCIQMLTGGERPTVRCATVYVLEGDVSADEADKAAAYLINPVESRRAELDKPETLRREYPVPADVKRVEGFRTLDAKGLEALRGEMGLAMDLGDLEFLQGYFRDDEGRDPTVTEIRVVDTYWSDHCRHTTFSTHLEQFDIRDPAVKQAFEDYLALRQEVYGPEKAAARPITLMDIATIAAKALKKRGGLKNLDESEEINACSIHVPVTTTPIEGGEAVTEDWLLMFKNETHNHPTEIEPFGGAATCIGGCIRDPLSGRAYVHQAMRITGCGDPRTPFAETLEGKLPQRKLCQTAAAGYSSYGNQIGLATGLVDEVYHPGYVAKHLEIGAVVGAAPAANVRRERPAAGDVVILLGGRTGRDGIGGATGSSKSHDLKSLDTMASEVQKGNAPEERKLQRLFRDPRVTRLIKRCNDFGAGGVSVAIGELADGLAIDLDAVRKKYDGLDGTELAISESQERMAVVVAEEDADALMAAAAKENLEAYRVAVVTESPRMVMKWRGKVICDLSREFLNTNGAVKHAAVTVPDRSGQGWPEAGYKDMEELAGSLECASRRGLAERFDATIGAGSVLMPFGGREQRTPEQAMAALFPVPPDRETGDGSVMSWGFDPAWMTADPFRGAYDSVRVSLARLAAAGGDPGRAYLTLQEYFEKLRDEPERWGKPFAALLGALKAQMDFKVAAIGGKDSMSGSFLDLDVPPTLVSFAIAPVKAEEVLPGEFQGPGHPVYLIELDHWTCFRDKARVLSARAVGHGGPAEAVMSMTFGNQVGFQSGGDLTMKPCPGFIVAETAETVPECPAVAAPLGMTTDKTALNINGRRDGIERLAWLNETALERVYPLRAAAPEGEAPVISWEKRSPAVFPGGIGKPRAVIPVFPGTNCEYDSVRACLKAGMEAETVVIRNLTARDLQESSLELEKAIRNAQIVFLPGGFSGGDEPDGSAKFICSFLRNPRLTDAVHDLLKNRDGLMLGICNGFQALVKLGLAPFGEIRDMDGSCPTLTFNTIGRHQSRYVTTRVASVNSPWMLKSQVGDLHAIPISHGEGRFMCSDEVLAGLIARGQVATQYVDGAGKPSLDISANPNGSVAAIEGIFSPDGRVFGKMGHSERRGQWLAKNVPGDKWQPIFESGALYFK